MISDRSDDHRSNPNLSATATLLNGCISVVPIVINLFVYRQRHSIATMINTTNNGLRLWQQTLLCSLLVLQTRAFILSPPSQKSNHIRASSRLAVSIPADLESMTVKDLRQLLKDSTLLERGDLSKLKRKKDLIDYIELKLPNSSPADSADEPDAPFEQPEAVEEDEEEEEEHIPIEKPVVVAEPATILPPAKKIRTGGMPQLQDPTTLNKEDMYEHVYRRYPPLRDENASNIGLGDEDVRQLHHPMLKAANNSDMDLITVGTASCSPGLTRGVSCTALRLNWQRRYLPTETTGNKKSNGRVEETNFIGGTWLFDVGECTQVRFCDLLMRR
jgi:hypothetical protein